jgi:hemerythrin-like domain-containing protein
MYGEMASEQSKSKLKLEIDQNLKRVYDDTLKEDVPDRFKKLLEQLKQQEQGPGEPQ